MKAVIVSKWGSPEVMKYVTVKDPVINSHQVLIKVIATSVNFADIKARYGKYHGASQPPFIPGLDVAGIIEEVGTEVRHLLPGQRVIAFPKLGSYAEYVVADEMLTFIIPDQIDFKTAAASPIVSFTSYNLLANVAKLTPGETVLIHAAAGGIGTTAVQIAKLLGAGRVIGTVGNKDKISVGLEAGYDHIIHMETHDFAKSVLEITDGQGVNIILDSIAGIVSEKSMECLAMYGRLVHFGNSSGEAGQFKTSDLHASCRSVLGYSLGTTRKERPHLLRDTANQVLPYLADHRLKMTIGQIFPLEKAADAHRLVESRLSIGKVLLSV